jgi:hypothetical protein
MPLLIECNYICPVFARKQSLPHKNSTEDASLV